MKARISVRTEDVASVVGAAVTAWRRSRYAFELLLERRLWLFLAVDALILMNGLFAALLAAGSLAEIYRRAVLVPMLVLGVPTLAGTVALERRAGSLDLALAVPSTEAYFLRRALPVCGLLVAQGWLITGVAYAIVYQDDLVGELLSPRVLFLVPTLFHAVEVGLLLGTTALFWGSRISSSGGVMVASGLSLAFLGPWLFANPVLTGLDLPQDRLLGVLPLNLLAVVWNLAVLGVAAVILYLYARERLRRPEALLA